jgi:hypothetical protein
MTPFEFQIYAAFVFIWSFLTGYYCTARYITGILGGVVVGVIVAIFVGGITIVIFDDMVSTETIKFSVTNLTIVDSFQGTGFLGGNDLTIKLSNGKVLHFLDPYEWKKFKVGDQYNFTRWERTSMITGTHESFNYDYLGVV